MNWPAFRERFLRFWRTEDRRLAAVRDVAVAGLVLALVLGSLWAFSGQPFPSEAPMVVVESGSMMHGPLSPARYGSPAFGRLGTIDPGDLVVVKRVHEPGDIETAFDGGGRSGYGGHGDVIVYRTGGTPIIHRALLYIEAVPEGCVPSAITDPCTYRIPETCNAVFAEFVMEGTSDGWQDYCEGSTRTISLSLRRDGLSLDLRDFPCLTECAPFRSGFITKGDNNGQPDQPAGGGRGVNLVGIDRVIGKARGEIPWFGLIKLAIAGNRRYTPGGDPTGATQWQILAARAPWDTWVCLFFAIGVIVAAPPALEFALKRWRERRPKDDG